MPRSKQAIRAAGALRQLVDRVSHQSGLVLAVMSTAGVTLAHVLLLDHVGRGRATSPSSLAEAMRVSLPAMSQTIDRLVQQRLLARADDPHDRRRKSLALTPRARALLAEIDRARNEEYARALAAVPAAVLVSLTRVLGDVSAALETSHVELSA